MSERVSGSAGTPECGALSLGRKVKVWPPVVLAPMAGVTNYPYRKICNDYGAGLCVSEMVSSRGILEGSAKTKQLAQFGPDERPRSMQIFGCEPEAMGRATGTVCDEFGVDHIDINFGCPVPKVTRKGMGAAALLNLENFRRVVGAVVKSADPIPVTIKVRLGMDDDYHTYVEAGRVAEGEGCQWIALHARTAKQMYSGKARWEHIRSLKEAIDIPVLGNGDIFEAPDAFTMMQATGCDGVVIGRGCLGNPWLFRNLVRLFDGRGVPERPPVGELIGVVREHFDLLCEYCDGNEWQAGLQMRKFCAWYMKGLEGSSQLRKETQNITTRGDLENILERASGLRYTHGMRDPSKPTRELQEA